MSQYRISIVARNDSTADVTDNNRAITRTSDASALVQFVNYLLQSPSSETKRAFVIDCEGIALGQPYGSLELIQLGIYKGHLRKRQLVHERQRQTKFDDMVFLIETSEHAVPEALGAVKRLLASSKVAMLGWGMRSDLVALHTSGFPIGCAVLDLQLFSSRDPNPETVCGVNDIMGLSRYCTVRNVSNKLAHAKSSLQDAVLIAQMEQHSTAPWFERPLTSDAAVYAAGDVLLVRDIAEKMAKAHYRFKKDWTHCVELSARLVSELTGDDAFVKAVRTQLSFFERYGRRTLVMSEEDFSAKMQTTPLVERAKEFDRLFKGYLAESWALHHDCALAKFDMQKVKTFMELCKV